MFKTFGLATVMVAAMAVPAFAQDCGTAPIPPSIATPADIASKSVEDARKVVLDAYHQVRAYQSSLKTYRTCLALEQQQDQSALQAAKDKKDNDQVSTLQDKISGEMKANDATVDSETQVANDFNTLHTAHCTRDTDAKICPKK